MDIDDLAVNSCHLGAPHTRAIVFVFVFIFEFVFVFVHVLIFVFVMANR